MWVELLNEVVCDLGRYWDAGGVGKSVVDVGLGEGNGVDLFHYRVESRSRGSDYLSAADTDVPLPLHELSSLGVDPFLPRSETSMERVVSYIVGQYTAVASLHPLAPSHLSLQVPLHPLEILRWLLGVLVSNQHPKERNVPVRSIRDVVEVRAYDGKIVKLHLPAEVLECVLGETVGDSSVDPEVLTALKGGLEGTVLGRVLRGAKSGEGFRMRGEGGFHHGPSFPSCTEIPGWQVSGNSITHCVAGSFASLRPPPPPPSPPLR